MINPQNDKPKEKASENARQELARLLPHQDYIEHWSIEKLVSGIQISLKLKIADKTLEHNQVLGLLNGERLPVQQIKRGWRESPEKIIYQAEFDEKVKIQSGSSPCEFNGGYKLKVWRKAKSNGNFNELLELFANCPENTNYAERLLKVVREYANNADER